jgi:hypothetical protein
MTHTTKEAYRTAHRLAQFFGHEWAQRELDFPAWAKSPRDLQAHIRVETLKARGNNLPGIAEPNLHWEHRFRTWTISHTTATGRTTYHILWADNDPVSLSFYVFRPNDQGEIYYHNQIGTPDAKGWYSGSLEARHWLALVEPIHWLDGNINQLVTAFPDRPWEAHIQLYEEEEGAWWGLAHEQKNTP